MIVLILYLISLVWIAIFLAYFVKPFKQKTKAKDQTIKYIPLKKPSNPNNKFIILNSGDLVEVSK